MSNRNYSPLYFCAAQALLNNCSGYELHRYLKRGDLLEFITTGNRIAVENFSIGKVYTIVWATGNYKSLACVGKGSDFVMFQDQAPDLLFCLTMDTAIAVESIEEGGGGAGTMNYNELENQPSINGIVLVGNKTGADLGLASQSDLEDYATNASVVAGLATKQDALSSSQLQAVNSGITSALVTQIGTNTSAIAGKQDALSSSQLQAVNSGITSALVTQIGTNTSAIAGKQDALSSSQLQAVNSGIDSTKVAQIETNKNNISLNENVALTYTTNAYVDSSTFGRCTCRKVSPHLLILTVNIYIPEPATQMTDFVEIGTLPYTLTTTCYASQGKATMYIGGNSLKVYLKDAAGGSTNHDLRQTIPLVVN